MAEPYTGISLGLICKWDEDPALVRHYLRRTRLHFDQIHVVLDSDGDTAPLERAIRQGLRPRDLARINLWTRPLDRDFAAQRNYLASRNTSPWLLMLDADEYMLPRHLKKLRSLAANAARSIPGLQVIGFPRLNLVDGETVNTGPDYQFRLTRRLVRWVNTHPSAGAAPGCHECPSPVLDNQDTVLAVKNIPIIHDKQSARLARHEALYDEPAKGPAAGPVVA